MNHNELPAEQPLLTQYSAQPKPIKKKSIYDLKDAVKTIKKENQSPPSKNISNNPLLFSSQNQSFGSCEDKYIPNLPNNIQNIEEKNVELKQKSQQELIKIIHSMNATIKVQNREIRQLKKKPSEQKDKNLPKNVEEFSSKVFSTKLLTQKKDKQSIIYVLEALNSLSNIRKLKSQKNPDKKKKEESKQEEKVEIKDKLSEQSILRNKVSASTEENSISDKSALNGSKNKVFQSVDAFKKEPAEKQTDELFDLSVRLQTIAVRKEEERDDESDDESFWKQWNQGNISQENKSRNK